MHADPYGKQIPDSYQLWSMRTAGNVCIMHVEKGDAYATCTAQSPSG